MLQILIKYRRLIVNLFLDSILTSVGWISFVGLTLIYLGWFFHARLAIPFDSSVELKRLVLGLLISTPVNLFCGYLIHAIALSVKHTKSITADTSAVIKKQIMEDDQNN